MKSKKTYSRRAFIGQASCAAIGGATFFSTFFNLRSLSAASVNNSTFNPGGGEDYRALVCILLGGGNDSYNMLVPTDNTHYQEYATTRSNLAIPQNDLLRLNPVTFNQKELGIHPAMPEVKALFDQGKVAFVNNVGTLVEPTTLGTYDAGAKLPFGLFSHFDQEKQWLTSMPHAQSTTGWAGRLADMVQSANASNDISMNISLGGKNIFQLGNQSAEYTILPTGNGSVGLHGFDESDDPYFQIRNAAVKSMLEKQYQDIFRGTYAEVMKSSQNAHELFSQAVGDSSISTAFSNNELSQSLLMVARTIKVRQSLGAKRQTFFVRFDGWDHHDELTNNHNMMLGVVSKAMSEFQSALAELNVEDCVTTFTVSDFARTLVSNGNGTDHGWGGNAMVMGGKVKGGDIYGNYPSLRLDSNLMLEGGVLIPQIATDEYFAELALWYGVQPGDLKDIFPNIGSFYNTQSNTSPLGFMNI